MSDSDYPWEVIPDPSGGYTLLFPDLPGCMTCVETLYHVGNTAAEIRDLWLATAREAGMAIPEPGTHNREVRLREQILRAIAIEVRDWRAAYQDVEAAMLTYEQLDELEQLSQRRYAESVAGDGPPYQRVSVSSYEMCDLLADYRRLRADNERLGRLEEACTGYFHRDSVTGDVYPPGWDKTQAEREALATIGRLLEEGR